MACEHAVSSMPQPCTIVPDLSSATAQNFVHDPTRLPASQLTARACSWSSASRSWHPAPVVMVLRSDALVVPRASQALGKDTAQVRAVGTRHAQLGDGSCLFHSLLAAVMMLGLRLASGISTALSLRRILLRWLVAHASKPYMGMTFIEWLRAERDEPRLSMKVYARRMQPTTAYGGALEIAAFVTPSRSRCGFGSRCVETDTSARRSLTAKPRRHAREGNYSVSSRTARRRLQ